MKNICYESTQECNLNCDYCISSDNCKEQAMAYDKIIGAIALFRPQRVVISGGEPLIDDELLDKLKLLKEKCPDSFVSISTNGVETKYDYRVLKDYIDCIDFSLPALNGNVYRQMRGRDCVESVKANIQKATEAAMNLRISYTLTKINGEELQPVLEYAEEMKVGEVRVGRFFPFRKAALCKEKYELTDDEIKKIMNSVNENDYSFRIVPPIEDLDRMENGYLTINYLGEIFLPSREGKRKIAMVGELDKSSISEIEEKQEEIFIHTNMMKKYDYMRNLLTPKRIRTSGYPRNDIGEYYSDRSRIIYSQAFRRLQQKAQVFSLETNASVRSRLSHSIEVADVGRLMAKKITEQMMELQEGNKYHINAEAAEQMVAITENVCLLHDLGNPPFGHFGEAAIQKWWNDNFRKYLKDYNKRAKRNNENAVAFTTQKQKRLLQDFQQFDGNPQGVRTILRFRNDEKIDMETDSVESGMNLTYQTVLGCVKYVRCAGEDIKQGIHKKLQKKAGYFQTEKRLLQQMYDSLHFSNERRFPIVYIMEAADDISYCMSDVADGIEKGLTTLKQFTEDLRQIWKERYNEDVPKVIITEEQQGKIDKEEWKDINIALIANWATELTRVAVENFMEKIDELMGGIAEEILPNVKVAKKGELSWCRLLETLREYARRKIYSTAEAETIEISGYSIIKGLLDDFGRLLVLTKDEFEYLLEPQNNPKERKLDVEARYLHLLGEKYINSYKNQKREWKNKPEEGLSEEQVEWWLRVHMVIDHIAGMTDDFALKTYQSCKGIRINMLQ